MAPADVAVVSRKPIGYGSDDNQTSRCVSPSTRDSTTIFWDESEATLDAAASHDGSSSVPAHGRSTSGAHRASSVAASCHVVPDQGRSEATREPETRPSRKRTE